MHFGLVALYGAGVDGAVIFKPETLAEKVPYWGLTVTFALLAAPATNAFTTAPPVVPSLVVAMAARDCENVSWVLEATSGME